MITIKKDGLAPSALPVPGHIPDHAPPPGAMDQDRVIRLANELYREGWAELFSEGTASEYEILKDIPAASLPGDGRTAAALMESPEIQAIRQTRVPADIIPAAQNILQDTDNLYYFLPGFSPEDASGSLSGRNMGSLDVQSIRKDFPILHRRINGKPLVWLDNAATTQKPRCVMDALTQYYSEYNSNVHRGAHTLAKLATSAYESAREKVQTFIGASSPEEIIFVRGTTEAINLVAQSYGLANVQSGDEILITHMEHHSNIVPWQPLKQAKGAVIKVAPVNDRGEIILEQYEKLLSPRTRMVAITHVSNVLGTLNPVEIMIQMAHKAGACVLVDGAQSVPHLPINVRTLDADFYAFSGHKAYGPTGIGVLYGKKALLNQMPPWQRGGGMIKNVTHQETTYERLPYKFEAGTGNIADAVGLGAAVDYLQKIGMTNIERHEREMTCHAMETLSRVPGLTLIGTAPDKTSVVSFILDSVSPETAAQHLNREGIAVRSGHHCAQPIMGRYGVASTVRASIGIYNTIDEINDFVQSVMKIAKNYH